MGHLLELPVNRTPPRAVEPGHSAAILFFTGVRYVRMEEPRPGEVVPRGPVFASRRKRKAPSAELQA